MINRKPIAKLPVPAERIRLREIFGATQESVAEHCNVIRRTVYAWEHGAEPTGRKRELYAKLLASWARTESATRDAVRELGSDLL